MSPRRGYFKLFIYVLLEGVILILCSVLIISCLCLFIIARYLTDKFFSGFRVFDIVGWWSMKCCEAFQSSEKELVFQFIFEIFLHKNQFPHPTKTKQRQKRRRKKTPPHKKVHACSRSCTFFCFNDWYIFPVLQVLREPNNALGKQYRKLFSMNDVSALLSSSLSCDSAALYLGFLHPG